MKIAETATAPLLNENKMLGALLRSKRVKTYTGFVIILAGAAVVLKLLFPPVPAARLESNERPLFTEKTGIEEDSKATLATDEQPQPSNTEPAAKVNQSSITTEIVPDIKSVPAIEAVQAEQQPDETNESFTAAEDPGQGLASRSIPAAPSKRETIQQEVLETTLYNRGVSFLQNRELYRAAQTFKEVLAVNPLNVQAYNNLGLALWTAGENDKAETAFKKALIVEPGYTKAMNNLALLYLQKQDATSAMNLLHRVLAEHPEDATAWSNLGVAYRMAGRLEDAGKAYTKALTLSPDDYRILLNLARTLELQGRTSEAILHYELFLKKLPASQVSHAAQVSKHLDTLKR